MTVKQYQDIAALNNLYKEHPNKKDKVLEGLLEAKQDLEYKEAVAQLTTYLETLNKEEHEFIARFKFKNVEYGLVPDLDKLSTREFLHLKRYESNTDNLHKLLAVLFRPIKQQYGDKYSIENFDEENMHDELFLDLDISIWLGIQSFFLTLHRQLLIHTVSSSLCELKKMNQKNQQGEKE
mgnify:CR=1 FL=1